MKQHSKRNKCSQTSFGSMTNVIGMAETSCMTEENAKLIHLKKT
jgi:hypothetical protein